MSIRITHPDAYWAPGDPALANGTFEFYKAGTHQRRFAGTNSSMTRVASFQNVLGPDSCPIEDLWVDSIEALDVVFRNDLGVELLRGPLSEHLAPLDPVLSLSTRVAQVEAVPPYPFMQPLQDKRGIWVETGGVWGPAVEVAPAGLVAAYKFNDGDTTAMVKNGFSWNDVSVPIVAPDGETETGIEFFYPGNPDPTDDHLAERRYAFTPMNECWIKSRIHIPTNYFHRATNTLLITEDISAWAPGQIVTGTDGVSTGEVYFINGQTVYLLFPDFLAWDSVWQGTITNTTLGQSVTSDRLDSQTHNNKLFVIFCDGYSGTGRSPTIIYEMQADMQGGSVVYYHWGADGTGAGHSDHPNSNSAQIPFIRADQDLGKWFDIVYHQKNASAVDVYDGVISMYLKREGEAEYTKILTSTDLSTWARPDANPPFEVWKQGYFFGAWNAGVGEDTSMHLSEVELHSSRPAELGDA